MADILTGGWTVCDWCVLVSVCACKRKLIQHVDRYFYLQFHFIDVFSEV